MPDSVSREEGFPGAARICPGPVVCRFEAGSCTSLPAWSSSLLERPVAVGSDRCAGDPEGHMEAALGTGASASGLGRPLSEVACGWP